jgi:hypothetical protein
MGKSRSSYDEDDWYDKEERMNDRRKRRHVREVKEEDEERAYVGRTDQTTRPKF